MIDGCLSTDYHTELRSSTTTTVAACDRSCLYADVLWLWAITSLPVAFTIARTTDCCMQAFYSSISHHSSPILGRRRNSGPWTTHCTP